MPMGRKEDFNIGYLGRTSKKLNLFAEIKGSLEGSSETLMGFRVRLSESVLTGVLTSGFKATASYKKTIDML